MNSKKSNFLVLRMMEDQVRCLFSVCVRVLFDRRTPSHLSRFAPSNFFCNNLEKVFLYQSNSALCGLPEEVGERVVQTVIKEALIDDHGIVVLSQLPHVISLDLRYALINRFQILIVVIQSVSISTETEDHPDR
jgi:hypothetical protein